MPDKESAYSSVMERLRLELLWMLPTQFAEQVSVRGLASRLQFLGILDAISQFDNFHVTLALPSYQWLVLQQKLQCYLSIMTEQTERAELQMAAGAPQQ